jgi:hypothetical protein
VPRPRGIPVPAPVLPRALQVRRREEQCRCSGGRGGAVQWREGCREALLGRAPGGGGSGGCVACGCLAAGPSAAAARSAAAGQGRPLLTRCPLRCRPLQAAVRRLRDRPVLVGPAGLRRRAALAGAGAGPLQQPQGFRHRCGRALDGAGRRAGWALGEPPGGCSQARLPGGTAPVHQCTPAVQCCPPRPLLLGARPLGARPPILGAPAPPATLASPTPAPAHTPALPPPARRRLYARAVSAAHPLP